MLKSASIRALLATTALGLVGLASAPAFAGGFEVPENTTKSVARGGTGAVMKSDPSALYFNPALLPRSRDTQVLLNVNMVNLNLEFHRDDLVVNEGNSREETKTFDPVQNEETFFPAPFLTASSDLGIDDFAVGVGIFGPSAYGERCYGKVGDDGCQVQPSDASRYMLVSSSLLEFYASLGAGYRFDVGAGHLSVGATGMLTYLDTNFSLRVYGSPDPGGAEEEDPADDATFRGRDLSDWAVTGTFGLAYDWQGFRVGASYRLPLSWRAEGRAEYEPAESTGLGELTDDGLILETNQAGSLRTGVGYEGGAHPGDANLARWDVEFNFVWEDWSRVEYFKVIPQGDMKILGVTEELDPIYQTKNYQDSFSYRLGGSYAFNDWVTGHAGGYYETAAQAPEYTNVDFVSWERYAMGAGASFAAYRGVEFDVGYMHVLSPQRDVTDGQVYSQVPLSECSPPEYAEDPCNGTPPGNPQNNGTWRSSFQLISMGFTYRYE